MFKTTAAAAVVWFALVMPNRLEAWSVAAFARIPLEGLALVAVLLLTRGVTRRVVAIAAGAALGLLVITNLIDIGFYAVLDRPFSPLVDWGSFGSGLGLLADTMGRAGQIGVLVLAVILVPAFGLLFTWSTRRLARAADHRRIEAGRAIVAALCLWLVCATIGLQVTSGAPVASVDAARLTLERAGAVRAEFEDRAVFADTIRADPQATVSADQLVGRLAGKDVLLVFIESYGRSAVQDSSFAPSITAALANGTARLAKVGYSSRSAFLTSPAFGGSSWLAHASVQTGLWVASQGRYDRLLAEDRRTLMSTFGEAGWRTVLHAPANTQPWPDGQRFYRADQVYDATNVGYQGPRFGYPTMPDQYTLAVFERREVTPVNRPPVMAEIDLLSSHAAWAMLPRMVDPDAVGDGSIYAGMPERGQSRQEVWRNPASVRASYAASIRYTVDALVTFIEQSSNDDLVLVVMGDHQPARIVSGPDADHDVPVSIITSDPGVRAATDDWAWHDGLHPDSDAPVWRMDEFRDRFFDTFSLPARR
ncbi:MAG: sulfatase-like hydrolase/transferase [Nocardioides sp.]